MSFLLDTDILSLFAKAEAIDLLRRLLRVERLAITQGVFNELTVPLGYGYHFPHSVFAASTTVSLSEDELTLYETLRLEGVVSAADAEQIAVCQIRGWAYVTMDQIAARAAQQRGVRTIGLPSLFKALQQAGILNGDALRTLLDRMERLDRTRFLFRDDLFSA